MRLEIGQFLFLYSFDFQRANLTVLYQKSHGIFCNFEHNLTDENPPQPLILFNSPVFLTTLFSL